MNRERIIVILGAMQLRILEGVLNIKLTIFLSQQRLDSSPVSRFGFYAYRLQIVEELMCSKGRWTWFSF